MPKLRELKPGEIRVKRNRPFPAVSYRVTDAADLVGVSRSTIYNMIAEGKLKTAKVGSSTVILHDDLMSVVTPAA